MRSHGTWLAAAALVASLSTAGCGGSHGAPVGAPIVAVGDPNDPRFASILTDVARDMQNNGVPGASVAVVLDGQLAFAAGLGVKEQGKSDPMLATTLFRVASLSKMVLAATVMTLVEEGKVDVSRPVTDYVPLVLAKGFDPSSIPLTDLLTHTSGLPDYDVKAACPVGPGQIPAYFAAHPPVSLWTLPGEIWDYSNRGYSVLGWVIEAATGGRFEDAVAARVFGPAGMTTATYEPSVAMASGNYAVGHHPIPGSSDAEYQPNSFDCEASRPPAGVLASAIDYAHFAEMLLASGGTTLAPASVSAMATGHVDTYQFPDGGELYGYGLYSDDWYKGLHVLRHNGDDTGYESTFWVVPDSKLAVLVFYNTDAVVPSTPVQQAVDVLLGLAEVPLASYTTPPSTWAPYTGAYYDPFGLHEVSVTETGGVLAISIPRYGFEAVPLLQQAGGRFNATLFNDVPVDVTFVPDAKGAEYWLVTRDGVAEREEVVPGAAAPVVTVLSVGPLGSNTPGSTPTRSLPTP
jgi:CubicO group peptidase (beta-lactamase class C family)